MTDGLHENPPKVRPLPGTIIKAAEMIELDALSAMRAEIEARRAAVDAECDALRAEARENGRREGLADAAVASARIVAATTARMGASADALSSIFASATMDAAAQIVGAPADPAVASQAVAAALARAQRHLSLRLFVWPAAVEQVQRAAEAAMRTRTDGATLLSVEPDPRLEPGRVVLSSELGYVEIGVTEQLGVAKDIVMRSFDSEITKMQTETEAASEDDADAQASAA